MMSDLVRRWNIEQDGSDILICFNDHEKGEPCEHQRFVPAEHIEKLEAEIESLTLERGQFEIWLAQERKQAGHLKNEIASLRNELIKATARAGL